ncbi:MAG: glycoside hydrolase family 5 protein [Verrucomicrobiota bacterium]
MILWTGSLDAQTPANLIPNGTLEADAKSKNWPDHWGKPEGATWENENGNHFLRLRVVEPGKSYLLHQAIPIKPEYQAMEFSFRTRYVNVKRGVQAWFDARIMMDFKDAANKVVKSNVKVPYFTGTSKDWVERKIKFLVPERAAKLEIMPTLFQAAAGTFDLDDFKLVVLTDPDATAQIAAAVKDSEVPPVTVRGNKATPKELVVSGNRLKTTDGQEVWLQGVNVPSLEWSNTGERVLNSIVEAIENWKANVIRLPVKDDRWFGLAGQTDNGKAYRELVDQAIEAASTRGAYVVLDLHQYRAPTEGTLKFWRDAAARYKNNPAVIFDLLNEPHGITWEVWKNGGTVSEKAKGGDGVLAENAQKTITFQSPGMQKVVEAIRESGAQNIIAAGGLDWAYDLSGILKGYALEDHGGHGIMYSTHVYSWKGDWKNKFLAVAEKYPLLVGECGCEPERMPFIPPERHENPDSWYPDLIGCIQQHKLNWTAWCFHPSAKPRLILDWKYAPTPFWGQPVKDALAGKAFEMKKTR